MEIKRIILLVILGAVIAVFGFMTPLGPLVLIVLVFIVLVLLLSDAKAWIESLVDKIASAKTVTSSEAMLLNESIAAIKSELVTMEQRLDALEYLETEAEKEMLLVSKMTSDGETIEKFDYTTDEGLKVVNELYLDLRGI
ncbi:MAG: hypothetical protein KAW93_07275 [Methanogenium sp.]|nr:hypothetical protein [Methanogenium sp.]